MSYIQKKPTYPKNPFNKTRNVIEDTFNKNISHLKNYLDNSYCDSIDPHYSIPIYDHTRSYSLCGFNPIKFYNETLLMLHPTDLVSAGFTFFPVARLSSAFFRYCSLGVTSSLPSVSSMAPR